MLHKDAESKDTLSMENIKKDTTEETPQGHEINANTCCKEDTTSLVKQSSTDSVSSDSQSVSNSNSKFLYFYQGRNNHILINITGPQKKKYPVLAI